jgi:hypothetical protein
MDRRAMIDEITRDIDETARLRIVAEQQRSERRAQHRQ